MSDRVSSDSGCSMPSIGCIIYLAGASIGGFFFDYALWSLFGKDVPWYADLIVGIFFWYVCFVAAIISWILRLCGVAVPILG